MTPEMLATLYGVGGTIIGAIIGAGVSVWITKIQLSASFRQLEIEVIKSQIATLQTALRQLSELTSETKEQDLSQEQILSRLTDMFQRRTGLFLSFSYLFAKDFEERLLVVSTQVNQFIYQAKTGQTIDESKAKECVREMQILDKEMFVLIREKLRALHSDFEKITVIPK